VTTPVVSVVIVSFNSRDDLLRCLDSLRAHLDLPHEIVVVDNASADGSAAAVRERHPEVRLLQSPENLGFARANNLGFQETTAPYVLVLNSDAQVHAGSVQGLIEVLEDRPEVGLVGPRTVNPDGTAQVSFGPMLTPVREWRQRRLVRGVRKGRRRYLDRAEAESRVEHEPVWVSGACFLVRREALDAVGGFDEQFFLYEEDVDLCVRVRAAGWSIIFTPRVEVMHRLGASMASARERARLEYHRSHLRFYEKHHGAAPSAFLRMALALRALASWTASLRPDRPGKTPPSHRELWRLAIERRGARTDRRTSPRPR
jgi:GT2 family glycosyltransferase